jgi:hypothetical protein
MLRHRMNSILDPFNCISIAGSHSLFLCAQPLSPRLHSACTQLAEDEGQIYSTAPIPLRAKAWSMPAKSAALSRAG